MPETYRILVLDDDPTQCDLFKLYLESTVGHIVDDVHCARDLYPLLESASYDLLFLDYRLPDATGLEILEELKARGISLPVIMMTGEGNEHIAVQAMQYGATDYLVKGDYQIVNLPGLISQTVQTSRLKASIEKSLEQIRYQAVLLNNIREAVVVWDLDGRITFWNKAAQHLYGGNPSERAGQSIDEVYLSHFVDPRDRMVREPESVEVERQYRRRMGETFWVGTRTTVLRDPQDDRRILGTIETSSNINRRKREQQALKESQHFVQHIVETTPNIVYIYDLVDRCIVYVNNEITNLFGYEPLEVQRMGSNLFPELVHPEDLERVISHHTQWHLFQDGQVRMIECRMRGRNRHWRWLSTRETIFSRDPAGKPRQIIGAAEDVTVRKETEHALGYRLEIERLIASVSSGLINLRDEDRDAGINRALKATGLFTDMDHAYVFLFSPDQQTLSATYSWSRFDSQDPMILNRPVNTQTISWLMNKLRMNETVLLVVHHLPSQANAMKKILESQGINKVMIIPLQYNAKLVGFLGFDTVQPDKTWKDEDVRMLRTVGEIIVNALIQKWAAQDLKESEARYRAVVDDHQTEIICRFFQDATLTFVNQPFCRSFGKDRKDMIGANFLEILPPEEREKMQAELNTLTIESPVGISEHPVLLPGGKLRFHEWITRAIYNSQGKFVEYQAVGRDVTERKEMEARMQAAQAQLAQQSRLAAIGQLASGIAHQIYNPLTTVIAEAQLLSGEMATTDQARESLGAIIQAGWRATTVVQKLQEFSQPSPDTLERLSINQTLEDALLLVRGHIERSGVRLQVDLEDNLPPVRANARQLEDLWVNLLLAARMGKADGELKTLSVRSFRGDGPQVVVEVRDDAGEIPPGALDNIFDPSLDSPASGRGSGFELSICREIVRQNRGMISACSNQMGTTFRIELPREA